jgi:uncharacterized protein
MHLKLLLLSFCIITSNCYAQIKVKKNVPNKVVKAKTYLPIPSSTKYRASDFEHVLTTQQIMYLDSIIRNFEKETTIEISVVTLGKQYTSKENFDSTILKIHDAWGVGKVNIDNGIVIGISSTFKKIRISNGNAVMEKLTNEMTKNIIEDLMIPSFKENKYYEGILKGLTEIISILK